VTRARARGRDTSVDATCVDSICGDEPVGGVVGTWRGDATVGGVVGTWRGDATVGGLVGTWRGDAMFVGVVREWSGDAVVGVESVMPAGLVHQARHRRVDIIFGA
jgi:hypothetical protein